MKKGESISLVEKFKADCIEHMNSSVYGWDNFADAEINGILSDVRQQVENHLDWWRQKEKGFFNDNTEEEITKEIQEEILFEVFKQIWKTLLV